MSQAARFLVSIEITRPTGIDDNTWGELLAAELSRGRELVHEGRLLGIWRITGQTANVGIWQAETHGLLHETLTSLPLFPYMTIRVQPVSEHPVGEFDITAARPDDAN